ncbi:MAG TPA: hypothetical protein VKY27_02005 [Bacteriovoracaceae bacterium]|nr:hypothetical protein [Bacteriovoracaceae bacterium]
MVEKIEKIRQTMAEQKYLEAQRLIEHALQFEKSNELLGLFLEIHLLQGMPLPHDQTISYINSTDDYHKSLELIQKLAVQSLESRIVEIKLYEKIGDLEELYNKISDFYIHLYERKIPRHFEEVQQLRKKYFASDFNLDLKELLLNLDRGWNQEVENEVRRLIKDCFQKSTVKNKEERLSLIEKVITGLNFNNSAKIYWNFFTLYLNGIQEKKDYKKIIELILYFEDLEFKSLILNLMDHLGLEDIATKYSDVIKTQKDYSFVYFEKYYPHLKKYLIQARPVIEETSSATEEIDLSLEESPKESYVPDWEDETALDTDLELAEGLKYQEFNLSGWLNLAVGFLQSDFNKSAFMCAKKVKELATNNTDFLKGSYLAIHALMKLRDYRLALDYCYEALEKVELETDILSFYYLEVELLIQLGEKRAAKKILNNIQAIDRSYRLSAKMLKRLNEI